MPLTQIAEYRKIFAEEGFVPKRTKDLQLLDSLSNHGLVGLDEPIRQALAEVQQQFVFARWYVVVGDENVLAAYEC